MNHTKQHVYKGTFQKAETASHCTDVPYKSATQLTKLSPKQSQICLTHKEWLLLSFKSTTSDSPLSGLQAFNDLQVSHKRDLAMTFLLH